MQDPEDLGSPALGLKAALKSSLLSPSPSVSHSISLVTSVLLLPTLPSPRRVHSLSFAGAFCMNPVVERVSGSLHMQLLSGCPPAVYWAGSYIWDMATHLLVCLASLAIFAAFDDKVCLRHMACPPFILPDAGYSFI